MRFSHLCHLLLWGTLLMAARPDTRAFAQIHKKVAVIGGGNINVHVWRILIYVCMISGLWPCPEACWAGIGGASVSYFLREHGIEVTVFESTEAVGGRSSSRGYPFSKPSERPQMMEMGAGILYTGNRYLYNISLLLGLHHVPSPPRSFGFWDGSKFAFRSGSTKFWTSMRMLWRYGRSLLRLTRTVKDRLADFMQLYDVQEQGRCFDHPADLLEAVGLFNLTQTTIEAYLSDQGLSQRILGELVAAVNRVNYNQDNQLNALAGVVSLCPLVTGSTFTIREGNGAIASALLDKAAAEVYTSTRADTVVIRHDGATGNRKYDVRTTSVGGMNSVAEGFDAVVVAAPLELAELRFVRQSQPGSEEDAPPAGVPDRRFQTTHTTWVLGPAPPIEWFANRSTAAGGFRGFLAKVAAITSLGKVLGRSKASLEPPDSVYLTSAGSDHAEVFFSSIGRYEEFDGHLRGGGGKGVGGGEGEGRGTGGRNKRRAVYKVFSPERLSDTQVGMCCLCCAVLSRCMKCVLVTLNSKLDFTGV